MGRSRKLLEKKAYSDSDGGVPLKSVVFLSSSGGEEANTDLSLEIVERAMERESKRKRAEVNGVISLPSASSKDIETNFEVEDKSKKKNSMGKSRKKNEVEAEAVKVVDDALGQEELVGTADSVVTKVNEVSDNVVLRKLLRGPRYFDPGEKDSGACFNCGEEGHNAIDCTMERRKKPCFVCGMFGHIAKRCTQGQDCYICKRRGHIAKNCPDKHNHTSQDSNMCLRCGDLGHDMLSCKNEYPPDDLKEIQCYVCKNYGHLCCADFVDDMPREVSCYNCAQPGHTGLGCAKPRGEIREVADVAPAKLCYNCGEEGHFVRGCTKNVKLNRSEGGFYTPRKSEQKEGGSSTPRKISRKNKDHLEFRSVPCDFGKARKIKKKKFEREYKWNMTLGKSRTKGGWIVDDPGDLPRNNHKENIWKSPSTPATRRKGLYSSASSGGRYSGSQSPFKNHGSFLGTPNFNASTSIHHQYNFSTPRFYGRSQNYYG